MPLALLCLDVPVLLLVQAPQPRVVAVLRDAGACGSVGPTSPKGWTTARVEGHARGSGLRPVEPHLLVADGYDGLLLAIRPAEGEAVVLEETYADEALAATAAATLIELFDARREDSRAVLVNALVTAFVDLDLDLDQLVEALEDALELPALVAPAPDRSAVVSRCDASLLRLAARAEGRVRLAAEGGWGILAPTDEVPDVSDLALAVAGAARRSEPTILLWRRGTHAGFRLWHGRADVSWSWGDPWRRVGAHNDAETVLHALGAASSRSLEGDDVVRLRALLHRPGDDPLLDLVETVGLPAAVGTALSGDGRAPLAGEELVDPASLVRGLLDAMVDAWGHPLPLMRSHRLPCAAYTAATVVATLVMLGMCGLSVAVLATDGAVVDQAGTGAEDWAFTAIATALTVTLLLTSTHRIRRLRHRRTRR